MDDRIRYDVIGTPTAKNYNFITAVKTTGIFCLPSCTARKPNYENVEFFSTTKQAIRSGYRSCLICNPISHASYSDGMRNALKQINKNPTLNISELIDSYKITLKELDNWFITHHKLSLDIYLQATRTLKDFKKLRSNNIDEVVTTVFYNSNDKKEDCTLNMISTHLGKMYVAVDDSGVVLCEFIDRSKIYNQFKYLTSNRNYNFKIGKHVLINQVKRQLNEYFNGERKQFSVPLSLNGSTFQNKVWNKLRELPYGYTTSYKDQSIRLGDIKAIRAIASANGQNMIAILIPCHRIIGSDGSLTGYAGGLDRKKWLINHEKSNCGMAYQGTLSLQ